MNEIERWHVQRIRWAHEMQWVPFGRPRGNRGQRAGRRVAHSQGEIMKMNPKVKTYVLSYEPVN